MLWSTPLSFSIAIVKLVFFSYVRIYFQGFFAVFFDDNFGITLLNLFLSFFKCDHVRTKDILIVWENLLFAKDLENIIIIIIIIIVIVIIVIIIIIIIVIITINVYKKVQFCWSPENFPWQLRILLSILAVSMVSWMHVLWS